MRVCVCTRVGHISYRSFWKYAVSKCPYPYVLLSFHCHFLLELVNLALLVELLHWRRYLKNGTLSLLWHFGRCFLVPLIPMWCYLAVIDMPWLLLCADFLWGDQWPPLCFSLVVLGRRIIFRPSSATSVSVLLLSLVEKGLPLFVCRFCSCSHVRSHLRVNGWNSSVTCTYILTCWLCFLLVLAIYLAMSRLDCRGWQVLSSSLSSLLVSDSSTTDSSMSRYLLDGGSWKWVGRVHGVVFDRCLLVGVYVWYFSAPR